MISTIKIVWWVIIISMILWVIYNFYWREEKPPIEKLSKSILDCMKKDMDNFSDKEFNDLSSNGFNRSSIKLYLQTTGQNEGLSDDGVDDLINQLYENIYDVKQNCKSLNK